MHLSAIVAMSQNRAIGKDNKLLWHLPADLAHFKHITMSKPILMGRKTFQSIGRPLPGRCNIVITRDRNFHAEGCVIVHSPHDALDAANDYEEAFVIGGAELYHLLLPKVQRLYLTIVHHHFTGDAFFPELDLSEWRECERVDHQADAKNQYPFSFITLERQQG